MKISYGITVHNESDELKNMSQIRQLDYDFKNIVPSRFLGEISED
mgnify:CR=1 FL=1